jgi:hypothetical protein
MYKVICLDIQSGLCVLIILFINLKEDSTYASNHFIQKLASSLTLINTLTPIRSLAIPSLSSQTIAHT